MQGLKLLIAKQTKSLDLALHILHNIPMCSEDSDRRKTRHHQHHSGHKLS